jgi:transcription termination factor Rho
MRQALLIGSESGLLETSEAGRYKLSFVQLQRRSTEELTVIAGSLQLAEPQGLRRADLLLAIARSFDSPDVEQFGEGCLDVHEEGFGFLRSEQHNYLPCPYDVYVSPSQIRRLNLRQGPRPYPAAQRGRALLRAP